MYTSQSIRASGPLAWLAAGLLVSATALAPAHGADGPQPSGGSTLQQLDTNQDGRVSRAEAQRDRTLGRHFDALDANHDGVLDAAELAAPEAQAAMRGTEVKP